MLNDNQSTLTAITNKRRANGLDVFIVDSINSTGGFLSGSTAYENYGTVGNRETGTVIARRKTNPTSSLEDISAMARTIAHELGHLIFNSGTHDGNGWNLMRDGKLGSTDNADLRLAGGLGQRGNISILPASYNVDETW